MTRSKKSAPQIDEELTPDEQAYLDQLPQQNHLGILTMVFGGLGFAFGPFFISIPIAALLFGFVTFRTYDSNQHDNPWPFYVGGILSLIGITLYIMQYVHEFS